MGCPFVRGRHHLGGCVQEGLGPRLVWRGVHSLFTKETPSANLNRDAFPLHKEHIPSQTAEALYNLAEDVTFVTRECTHQLNSQGMPPLYKGKAPFSQTV
ncbi:hypothetical protein FNV43_RR02673 [Rhamnella rubrinervis]|uniref:Uncharacterized protein n=1 Tax=Rhamnella rubrinervis TaxID=2594499 RepID=A0A8K0HTS9_9ROSA|nr:hypothetical protein FNV43_RR02673 [Rhamnella rubrinervis]